ncbi:M28 family peptidase [Paenibacillus sp. M1]|uniref:M28 family peptidase n=1 Tax=Paenibacillus haidiansis TaxID=1574488 RepID=A0ABU7VM13_9BACL
MEMKEAVKRHIHYLCQEIGPRPTGSDNNRHAVEYCLKELKEAGLRVHLQEFDCMDWKNNGAVLTVDGHPVQVVAADYSLPCRCEAEIVPIGTVSALRESDLKGKIAVLFGELCKEPLMPKNFFFYNPEEHKEIITLLEKKGPLAVITVSNTPKLPVPVIEDGDFDIPCAAAAGNDLPVFLGAAGSKAYLHVKAERKAAKSANVIAAFGNGPSTLSFSAHLDTKPASSGALDNASGVAVLLALAPLLKNKKLSHKVEIVFFNGEDYYSAPGEMAYLSSDLFRSGNYTHAFNIDGVGLIGSNTSLSFYASSPELERLIGDRAGKIPGFVVTEPWPQGDHMLFASTGIPTVAVTSASIFGLADSILHTPDDNLSLLDPDNLVRVIRFLESCLEDLAIG